MTSKNKIISANIKMIEYAEVIKNAAENDMTISEYIKFMVLQDPKKYDKGGEILDLNNELEQKYSELKHKFQSLEESNRNWQDRYRDVNNKNTLLLTRIEQLQSDSSEMEDRIAELEQENNELQEQLENTSKPKSNKPKTLLYQVDGKRRLVNTLIDKSVFREYFGSKKAMIEWIDDDSSDYDYVCYFIGKYFIFRATERVFFYGYSKYLDDVLPEMFDYLKQRQLVDDNDKEFFFGDDFIVKLK